MTSAGNQEATIRGWANGFHMAIVSGEDSTVVRFRTSGPVSGPGGAPRLKLRRCRLNCHLATVRNRMGAGPTGAEEHRAGASLMKGRRVAREAAP
jgi:hypothetical protein